jgi:hypothetical protein
MKIDGCMVNSLKHSLKSVKRIRYYILTETSTDYR